MLPFNKNKKNVKNKVIYTLFYKEQFVYILVSVVLIIISPIIFIFFNVLLLGFLLYYHIKSVTCSSSIFFFIDLVFALQLLFLFISA